MNRGTKYRILAGVVLAIVAAFYFGVGLVTVAHGGDGGTETFAWAKLGVALVLAAGATALFLG